MRSALSPGTYKKGEFRIAPISTSFTLETKRCVKCPAKSIECTIVGFPHRMFINPTYGSQNCKVCPRFWHVRYTDVSTDCNMKLVNYTTDDEPKLTLQILENTKAIKAGEELVYYRKALAVQSHKDKSEHRPPLLEQKTYAKKQRTE